MAARLAMGDGRIVFRLRLTPKGGRDAIEGWVRGANGSEYLKARGRVPSEDGKANAALIALLAEQLDVAKSVIDIVAGETVRLKTIAIRSAAALAARLEKIGDKP